MCCQEPILLSITLKLLKERKTSLKVIANAIGEKEDWIRKLATSDSIEHPSVNRIEKLYSFLSGKALVL